MSLSKKINLQRDFAVGLSEFYRMEIQSAMLLFSTKLSELLPGKLLSGSPPTLPCSNKKDSIQVYTVQGGGKGVWGYGAIGGEGASDR